MTEFVKYNAWCVKHGFKASNPHTLTVYLILNGSFRFVEESLRGEPQTPYFLGMRVYQWLALISIILGAVFTCLDSPKLLPSVLDRNLIIHSLIYGVIVFIAYGVDFPKSNLRFSRLTQ